MIVVTIATVRAMMGVTIGAIAAVVGVGAVPNGNGRNRGKVLSGKLGIVLPSWSFLG